MPQRRADTLKQQPCGRLASFPRLTAAIVALLFLLTRSPVALAQETRPATPALLPWHTTYAQALDEALQKQLPIVAEVGAEWCEWCRLLDLEIAKPQAQEKLAAWVRLKIDSDRDAETVRQLAVGPIPALRILTSGGRVVAAHNGFLNVQDLVAWLNDHYQQAVAVPAEQLAGNAPATSADVDALVKELTNPDAIVRETTRRSAPDAVSRAACRPAAVSALLETGNLRQRLAALDLLHAWGAPVEGLDPWDSATFSKERLAGVKTWLNSPAAAAATQPENLTADQLSGARRDISTLLQAANEAEVQAPRERLGSHWVPAFDSGSSGSVGGGCRRTAIASGCWARTCYRLAASEALAVNWPDGFERIASTNQQIRRESLDSLASKLTPDDEPFPHRAVLRALITAFVRERSIEFMQAVGSDAARAGLVKLLHDPEPNVRAAVLRQLSETPDAHLVPEIAKYAESETDPDLVVHAVRFARPE